MPRILVKGGIWKNTEDEILKVAVMKYGKNQWSRIASLLHKKTAKQCKTRWYEWLDPHIKKTEWSRDEDEKLLHLAKLMPTQWRTIAPIVGRTAALCLERYEFLLDQVQEVATEDNTTGSISGVSDPRKLKPGEIDPNPESKPAKPDAIDMDEDELEMLSEARARLANTQGKKAKRKARERQLDEARRLSSMQKRRELMAAGIQGFRTIGRRKLRTFIDYAKEVPFERKAPQGFFDANEDQFNKNDPDFIAFQKNLQKELNEKNESLQRRKDKEKQKRKLESDPESAILQVHGNNIANEIFTKRAKLTLPEPQVNDDELEQVVKIGMETQNSRALVENKLETNGIVFDTADLLADYSATPNISDSNKKSKLRTPMTVSRETNILNEARNIIALNNVQTPLMGGTNTELDVEKIDFSGINPKGTVVQTPNTVLRQPDSTNINSRLGISTPSMSIRDNMGINSSKTISEFSDTSIVNRKNDSLLPTMTDDIATPSTVVSNFSRSSKLEKKLEKLQLRSMFNQLPQPEDDFEIVLPPSKESSTETIPTINKEENEKELLFSKKKDTKPSVFLSQDSAELENEKQRILDMQYKKRLSTLSVVVQQGLPHPLTAISHTNKSELSESDRLIQQEMLTMLKHMLSNDIDMIVDSSLKPLGLNKKKFLSKHMQNSAKVTSCNELDVECLSKYMDHANKLIDDEFTILTKNVSFDKDFIQFSETIDNINQSILYSNSYSNGNNNNLESNIDILREELDYLKDIMTKYSRRVSKSQTKLEILVGGYQRNYNSFLSKYEKLMENYESLLRDRAMFNELMHTENRILENRIAVWKNKANEQKSIQRELQQRYINLQSKNISKI